MPSIYLLLINTISPDAKTVLRTIFKRIVKGTVEIPLEGFCPRKIELDKVDLVVVEICEIAILYDFLNIWLGLIIHQQRPQVVNLP